MTAKECDACGGRGQEWGETCIPCGGRGEVCGACGGCIADGECLSCDARVDEVDGDEDLDAKAEAAGERLAWVHEELVRVNQAAVAAVRQHRDTGVMPAQLDEAVRRLISIVPLDPSKHERDSHCLVDRDTDVCVVCDAVHGEPCAACLGRGFHTTPCSLLDELCG